VLGGGGGGGGTPSGKDGYVQFNKNGAFGADSVFHWDNITKVLSIGTDNDSVGGYPGDLVIQGNTTGTGVGRIIVGGTGAYQDLIFTKTNAFEQHKAWAFGSRYDSYFDNEEGAFSLIGVNYDDNLVVPIIANPSGNLVLAGAGNAINGTVSVGPPMDAGYKFEVNGSAYMGSGLNVDGNLQSNQKLTNRGSRIKNVTYFNDTTEESDTYYVSGNDHIIIFDNNNDNGYVYLPNDVENGREIIVRQTGLGASGIYHVHVYGNGHTISYGEVNDYTSVDVPDTPPNSITFIYFDPLDDGNGYWYVMNSN
jgi:hypothetical protein